MQYGVVVCIECPLRTEFVSPMCIFRKFIVNLIESWNDTTEVKEKRCLWNIEREG